MEAPSSLIKGKLKYSPNLTALPGVCVYGIRPCDSFGQRLVTLLVTIRIRIFIATRPKLLEVLPSTLR